MIPKKGEKWSGRQDLNLRPLHPQRSALPDCATSRPQYLQKQRYYADLITLFSQAKGMSVQYSLFLKLIKICCETSIIFLLHLSYYDTNT